MSKSNPVALDFLLTRRSRPAKTLAAPAPNHEAIRTLLTAAARSPDHGKLEPWRFVVLEGAALARLADLAARRGAELALEPERIGKGVSQFTASHLAIAVISAPVVSEKVPQIEQTLSAGAVCLALLNAAEAAGWGANWLTGWPAHDRGFVETGLGLAPHEFVAGFVHLGTETSEPPERPRPDLDKIVTWVAE